MCSSDLQCPTHNAFLACCHSFAESMEPLKQKEVGEEQLGATLECVESDAGRLLYLIYMILLSLDTHVLQIIYI